MSPNYHSPQQIGFVPNEILVVIRVDVILQRAFEVSPLQPSSERGVLRAVEVAQDILRSEESPVANYKPEAVRKPRHDVMVGWGGDDFVEGFGKVEHGATEGGGGPVTPLLSRVAAIDAARAGSCVLGTEMVYGNA